MRHGAQLEQERGRERERERETGPETRERKKEERKGKSLGRENTNERERERKETLERVNYFYCVYMFGGVRRRTKEFHCLEQNLNPKAFNLKLKKAAMNCTVQ